MRMQVSGEQHPRLRTLWFGNRTKNPKREISADIPLHILDFITRSPVSLEIFQGNLWNCHNFETDVWLRSAWFLEIFPLWCRGRCRSVQSDPNGTSRILSTLSACYVPGQVRCHGASECWQSSSGTYSR